MSNSRTNENRMNLMQSQYSQPYNYNFQNQSRQKDRGQTLITDSQFFDYSNKIIYETPQTNKKLSVKDLESQRVPLQGVKISGKQNNIPNQGLQNSNQLRKITIYKNNNLNGYYPNQNPSIDQHNKKNKIDQSSFKTGVDQSFTTSKIVHLQEQLLNLRKQLSFKESSWIKQKTILLNKIQISNFDVAQMKQRNNNLIQINQTLTQVLGQINKNPNENLEINDNHKHQLNQKNQRIKQLQEKLQKQVKVKEQINNKFGQEKHRSDLMNRNLEQYKRVLKQSNQRKLQSDEKIIQFSKKLQLLKKKLKFLPIKDQYLTPVYAFISSIQLMQYENALDSHQFDSSEFLSESNPQYDHQSQNIYEESQVRPYINKKNQQFKFNRQTSVRFQKNNHYQQNIPFQQSSRYEQPYNINCYNDDSSCFPKQNEHIKNQMSKHLSKNTNQQYFSKQENIKGKQRKSHFFHQSNRIQTEEQNFDEFQELSEQQVYLCQVCQRVYPHQDFLDHMNDCQQYQTLLKQKKQIQSKLISIKQQEYDNRTSNTSSLNTSAIILNKSRSKGKFIRPSVPSICINNLSNQRQNNNTYMRERTDRQRRKYDPQSNSHGNEISNQTQNYNGYLKHINQDKKYHLRKNDNKTQRYGKNDQSTQKSRLQLSQLLNISNISNLPTAFQKNSKNKKKQANNNRNTSFNLRNFERYDDQNYANQSIQNIQNYSQNYQSNKSSNYQPKNTPQIKYQTIMMNQKNIQNNSSNHLGRNSTDQIGKESMQDQIRKIVEALNQGGKKQQFNMKKQQNKISTSRNTSISSKNPSLTARTNIQKDQFEAQKTQKHKNYRNQKSQFF